MSFAISHTRLAVLLWGPRPAVERRHHAPHQHRSELDSRLRRRSGKGLQLEKRLPDTQRRVAEAETAAEAADAAETEDAAEAETAVGVEQEIENDIMRQKRKN